uniref:COP9 signalosome subunit 7B n=1 Tax=Sus scrofa TaxID=9823 RepID=A0A8D0QE02_PIG
MSHITRRPNKRSQGQRMAGEQKPSSNLLEQFILLAKGTSGSALTALISQVLEAPGVYVFGELLELANVQELAEGANAAYLQLLNLFAYGTYPDYIVYSLLRAAEGPGDAEPPGTGRPHHRGCLHGYHPGQAGPAKPAAGSGFLHWP